MTSDLKMRQCPHRIHAFLVRFGVFGIYDHPLPVRTFYFQFPKKIETSAPHMRIHFRPDDVPLFVIYVCTLFQAHINGHFHLRFENVASLYRAQ